ncbi:MAG TPA: biotin/lipoyl-containing protein [Fimbriimonas sp.]|nr:biotin/lipoyl-containing protein [Fimbriimonas sp.]
MANLDLGLVKHALDLAQRVGMDHVDLEVGDAKFSATLSGSKSKPAPVAVVATHPATPSEPASTHKAIKSHNVGIFRSAGHPLEVGQPVSVGDVLGSIVALGISNDIVASIQGTVTEVNVSDSEAVEYGQILALVEA